MAEADETVCTKLPWKFEYESDWEQSDEEASVVGKPSDKEPIAVMVNRLGSKQCAIQQLDQRLQYVWDQEKMAMPTDPGYSAIQESRAILGILKAYPELAAKKFTLFPECFREYLKNAPSRELPKAVPLFHLLNIMNLPIDALKEAYELYPAATFSQCVEEDAIERKPRQMEKVGSKELYPLVCLLLEQVDYLGLLQRDMQDAGRRNDITRAGNLQAKLQTQTAIAARNLEQLIELKRRHMQEAGSKEDSLRLQGEATKLEELLWGMQDATLRNLWHANCQHLIALSARLKEEVMHLEELWAYYCSPLFFAVHKSSRLDVISFLVSKNPEAVSEPDSWGMLPIERYVDSIFDEDDVAVMKLLLDVAPVGIFTTNKPTNSSIFNTAICPDIRNHFARRCGPAVRALLAEKIPRGVHNALLDDAYECNDLVDFLTKLNPNQKINLCLSGLCIDADAVVAMTDSVLSLDLDKCHCEDLFWQAPPDWSSCQVEKITFSLPNIHNTSHELLGRQRGQLQWMLSGFSSMPNLRELCLDVTWHFQRHLGDLFSFVYYALSQSRFALQHLEIRGFVMEQGCLVEMLSKPECTRDCVIAFQGPNEPEPVLAISYHSAVKCHTSDISNWTTKNQLIGGLLAVAADQKVLAPLKLSTLFEVMLANPSLWADEKPNPVAPTNPPTVVNDKAQEPQLEDNNLARVDLCMEHVDAKDSAATKKRSPVAVLTCAKRAKHANHKREDQNAEPTENGVDT